MKRLADLARAAALLAPALVTACAGGGPHGRDDSPWHHAAGATRDDDLAALCREYWELSLRQDPIHATYLGDARYYGALPADAPAQRAHDLEQRRRLLRTVRSVDPGRLRGEDRVTLAMLEESLDLSIAVDSHPIARHAWELSALDGPQVRFLSLAIDQPRATPREREQYLERWGRMSSAIARASGDLREGLREGRVASRHAVETVIAQLDAVLATPPRSSPLVTPAAGGGRWVALGPDESISLRLETEGLDEDAVDWFRHLRTADAEGTAWAFVPAADDPLDAEQRARFLGEALRLTAARIYPAFRRYRDVLADEVLPAARSDEEPGVGALPGGRDYYALMVRLHTSLDLPPEEIHALGLAELERIHAEMRDVGERAFGTRDLAEIQRRLREDPALHFETAEEIVATAERSLARAEAAVPAVFGRLPRAACVVVPVPAHEAPNTTVAYYRQPAPDGSRPGRYYVNTYAPTTRTRYEAEVLAYHEAVPGHHTQIAIAQELDGLPLFRRHEGCTAYVEGWALYTERLCDELGLYTGDVDRLGLLSFDSWRASRLVVDTGLHAMGWSRDRAIEFLVDNTLLAENNCANEVDRYIAWPGQALAYKLGQREILALRAQATEQLGDAFALSDFHDVVLGSGAVTLAALRGIVEEWIAAGGGAPRDASSGSGDPQGSAE